MEPEGFNWTALVVATLIFLAAVTFIAVAIRTKRKSDERREDYLEKHPETDPHSRRSRDRYDDPRRP